MPVKLKKIGTKYQVSTPHGVKAKGTTKEKAEAQARLLRGVEHGWKPTMKESWKGTEAPVKEPETKPDTTTTPSKPDRSPDREPSKHPNPFRRKTPNPAHDPAPEKAMREARALRIVDQLLEDAPILNAFSRHHRRRSRIHRFRQSKLLPNN